jgi:hypothetical protein
MPSPLEELEAAFPVRGFVEYPDASATTLR